MNKRGVIIVHEICKRLKKVRNDRKSEGARG